MPLEKAILVQVELKEKGSAHGEGALEELRRLSRTAGAQAVCEISARLAAYNPATLVGKGKAEEIAQAVREHRASVVIMDADLSPAQQRNLEDACGAKVIDRTRLILDIFASRARTREGELQVELAQLSYMLPRLSGRGAAMMQQTGGIGTRGPGERKLEYDKRRIRTRIAKLKEDLDAVKKERAVQRKKRAQVPLPQVAIAGYTNAGKSTLLNLLSGGSKSVYADDLLFATLDTSTRRAKLGNRSSALFTDTVGFIQRLPHTLVAAFQSTLEEITHADCILRVHDASSPLLEEQKKVVEQTIGELEAGDIPALDVFNKLDVCPPHAAQALRLKYPRALFVSARTGSGIPELLEKTSAKLSAVWKPRRLLVPALAAELAGEIHSTCLVTGSEAAEQGVLMLFNATDGTWERLKAKAAALDCRD